VSPFQVPEDLIAGPYRDLLSPDEAAYVAAAGEPQLQRDRLLARALVRVTLAHYCGGAVGWDAWPPLHKLSIDKLSCFH